MIDLTLTEADVERFFDKIAIPEDKAGCWLWTASQKNIGRRGSTVGYGQFYLRSHMEAAHRVAYWHANGPFAQELLICHTCDNPPCVNPKHLFAGTSQDNVNDRGEKNRQARGDNLGTGKLKEVQVHEIRKLLATKLTHKEIGAKYGVSRHAITDINSGRKWGWLK